MRSYQAAYARLESTLLQMLDWRAGKLGSLGLKSHHRSGLGEDAHWTLVNRQKKKIKKKEEYELGTAKQTRGRRVRLKLEKEEVFVFKLNEPK